MTHSAIPELLQRSLLGMVPMGHFCSRGLFIFYEAIAESWENFIDAITQAEGEQTSSTDRAHP